MSRMEKRKKYLLFGVLIVVFLVLLVFGLRRVRHLPTQLEIEPYKVKGAPEAPIYILVFSDFECPYCNKIRPTLDKLLEMYPTQLKLVFKHYPLKSHKNAIVAAEAAECAADQGKFWDYHDALFKNIFEWFGVEKTDEKFIRYAGGLGLNTSQFQSCIESHSKRAVVDKNRTEGRHFFVSGTPTLIMNGRIILKGYNIEYLTRMVEEQLEKLRPATKEQT